MSESTALIVLPVATDEARKIAARDIRDAVMAFNDAVSVACAYNLTVDVALTSAPSPALTVRSITRKGTF